MLPSSATTILPNDWIGCAHSLDCTGHGSEAPLDDGHDRRRLHPQEPADAAELWRTPLPALANRSRFIRRRSYGASSGVVASRRRGRSSEGHSLAIEL